MLLFLLYLSYSLLLELLLVDLKTDILKNCKEKSYRGKTFNRICL